MLKVGLTGNYFSGIDDISNTYKKLKIPVFEVDLIIKFMLYNNQDTIEKIREEFAQTPHYGLVVKWISFLTTDQTFGVRIPTSPPL